MSPEHEERKFTSKIQPQKRKEVELINYLLDCYERVAFEERTSPKVSHCCIFPSIKLFDNISLH